MPAFEPVLALLGLLAVALAALAVMLAAALRGHGPLYGTFIVARLTQQTNVQTRLSQLDGRELLGLSDDPAPAPAAAPNDGGRSESSAGRRSDLRPDGSPRRQMRPPDEGELDEVLRGSFAAAAFNRAARVLTWSFILAVLVIVSISQLWRPVEPQIYITLTAAGIAVLVLHELLPAESLDGPRVIAEASGAVVFLTMLILLTGNVQSPFFFLYPLLVGGAALVASPRVTILLTGEAVLAYAVAALWGTTGAPSAETLARVGINLAALVLLSYAGIAISRVQRRIREAAIRLSTVDSLTDLHNRAFLFNAVDREIERSRRFRRGFCLLMMDLDGLKAVNDRFGHFQGDLVLQGVAGSIRSSLRRVDTAARYGGDEFVALLPETDPSGAYVVAEKIRQKVNELVVESGGQRIATSLSIGVVSYPEDGDTADELMIAADEAMYSSKRLGKNRVVGYADPRGGAGGRISADGIDVSGFRPLEREPKEEGPM